MFHNPIDQQLENLSGMLLDWPCYNLSLPKHQQEKICQPYATEKELKMRLNKNYKKRLLTINLADFIVSEIT